MPNSPSSAPTSERSRSPSGTKRSTVSTAFNNGPTMDASSLGSQHSGGKGASGVAGSAVFARHTSQPTAGSMVNPGATASELLAKASTATQRSTLLGSVAVSRASSPLRSGASTRPSGVTPSQTSPPPSQAQGGAKQSQVTGEFQPSAAPIAPGSTSSISVKNNAEIPIVSTVGHGMVDVNMKTGAILQICFSLAALVIYASLWIFLLAAAACYNDLRWDFAMKCIAMGSAVCSFFVLAHSCFEHKVSTRGIFGCAIFFILACVIFLNILVGFKAMNCSCRCASGDSAWALGASTDLAIFGLSLTGALCLIIVLLVASVAHE